MTGSMGIEYLLTATRSARKSLDLDAPVDLEDIRECLRIGLQAANGSNSQAWRWLVVDDPTLRNKIAELYRDAYLKRVGGQLLAALLPAGTPEGRLMSSTEWLDRGTWAQKEKYRCW
jgi:nitroreductase